MSLEQAFLRDVREHPEESALRLIFADWLEEHDDPRGVFLRDLTPFEERYELRELSHTCGLIQSYRAMDRRKQRLVNVDLGHGVDPDSFWREATIAARYCHPSLLPLLDFGFLETSGLFQVHPAVEGEHLKTRLHRWDGGPPAETYWSTLPRLVHALRAVAAAVACVHEHGFIHRSLGPSTIFLGLRSDEVFVCEWDCAATREECQASNGAIVGKPAYIAPEQVRSPETVTPSTDIHGLGGILYELLYGRPPNVPPGTHGSTLEVIRRGRAEDARRAPSRSLARPCGTVALSRLLRAAVRCCSFRHALADSGA